MRKKNKIGEELSREIWGSRVLEQDKQFPEADGEYVQVTENKKKKKLEYSDLIPTPELIYSSFSQYPESSALLSFFSIILHCWAVW